MSNLSRITIGGNLTRDPEQKEVGAGRSLVEFTVACSRWNRRQKEEYTTFYRVTVWQEHLQARILAKCAKGTGVTVAGDYDPVPKEGVDGAVYHNVTQPSVEFGARQKQVQHSAPRQDDGYQPVDNDDDIPF